MIDHSIGVDISKDWLDAHRLIDAKSRRFANHRRGFRALIAWMGDGTNESVVRVVYEPTGPYHRKLEQALAAAGLPLVKVNPRRAHRFFDAAGQIAKTDRLDAAMLARMGCLLALAPRLPRTPMLNQLKDLHMAREALVKDRTAAKNRAKTLVLPLLKRCNAERMRQIERQMQAIEAEIMAHIQADPDLAATFAILVSIPGISAVTAFALIIDMPELGALEPNEAAALAGLAPITRQSGQWRGRAFIRGGRANLRRALYMPALVAARFNPDLKAKYDKLRAVGKPPKLAITAVMRKLVILANALIKAQRTWAPKQA
jgi:transposase